MVWSCPLAKAVDVGRLFYKSTGNFEMIEKKEKKKLWKGWHDY